MAAGPRCHVRPRVREVSVRWSLCGRAGRTRENLHTTILLAQRQHTKGRKAASHAKLRMRRTLAKTVIMMVPRGSSDLASLQAKMTDHCKRRAGCSCDGRWSGVDLRQSERGSARIEGSRSAGMGVPQDRRVPSECTRATRLRRNEQTDVRSFRGSWGRERRRRNPGSVDKVGSYTTSSRYMLC